ncbi:MAG: DUF2155 domain-containing protein [Proteobacteria bacterium]|nr:DUF2155 domain-containing protein [Pseudomonadota bacterium]
MRHALLPVLLCLSVHAAAAQSSPPLQETSPPQSDSLLPPSLRGLAPRAPAAPEAAAPDAPAVPPPDMTPQQQWANKWLPAGTAQLHALDKVTAQVGNLTVKVGQTATFQSLTITVKSCLVRPPDQPADAAVFVEVADTHPDAPGFAGWLLANEPAVSMMQSPIYDLRVSGCS